MSGYAQPCASGSRARALARRALCRAVLAQLDQTVETALILNPALEPDSLIRNIGLEFGLSVPLAIRRVEKGRVIRQAAPQTLSSIYIPAVRR